MNERPKKCYPSKYLTCVATMCMRAQLQLVVAFIISSLHRLQACSRVLDGQADKSSVYPRVSISRCTEINSLWHWQVIGSYSQPVMSNVFLKETALWHVILQLLLNALKCKKVRYPDYTKCIHVREERAECCRL